MSHPSNTGWTARVTARPGAVRREQNAAIAQGALGVAAEEFVMVPAPTPASAAIEDRDEDEDELASVRERAAARMRDPAVTAGIVRELLFGERSASLVHVGAERGAGAAERRPPAAYEDKEPWETDEWTMEIPEADRAALEPGHLRGYGGAGHGVGPGFGPPQARRSYGGPPPPT
eukprot:tig00000128_g7205.t1